MGVHVIKLPDVGEGVAEAEFVELHVKNGDEVQADQTLADVMTDKATVEIPSPVAGKVIWIGPGIGETIAVGTEIFKLEVAGAGNSKEPVEAQAEPQQKEEPKAAKTQKAPEPKEEKPAPAPAKPAPAPANNGSSVNAQRPNGAVRKPNEKPLASPAVRKSAQDQGIDLRFVHGSGPAGRITHDDLEAYAAGNAPGIEARSSGYQPNTSVEEIKVIGLRRKIAQKMQDAKRRIPHASYVDEIDVTALEELRQHMNAARKEGQPKLTLLPFLMRAVVMSVRDFPQVNARYDDENDIVQRYGAAHIGIATQTDTGLIVPVVRHAEANDLWTNAGEIKRLSDAARDGTAKREELSGSTITITSLGAIGGIASTPVINAPEVAIIGVNKIVTRPMYNDEGQVVPRKLMNLSSSFDHRVVDGWDMAQFIQTIKAYLEFPATMFMEN
ncbi:2-oxo acid dehydrogenase subunit E2 [Parvularcula flava]|uniref:Dihydrolipoamide acetyltransferase component of pyruvate dehydrogenase complex n=1 Tax=Aquisalinus luteolus TaxID=1566827 RepID=A0A8J3A456_9PROT|nr:dihydrolipoamide acetyltransferase family protein [Aquisalinus luteolus]NHK28513.1 2-oxo acid dehydrogenase subunit E2 [Aquisalinus luteolus]GGH98703.1 dihydrolipoamide acetyltransferase component of pyruvate dehydrogenase complex [Aquisalinus luteolus]